MSDWNSVDESNPKGDDVASDHVVAMPQFTGWYLVEVVGSTHPLPTMNEL